MQESLIPWGNAGSNLLLSTHGALGRTLVGKKGETIGDGWMYQERLGISPCHTGTSQSSRKLHNYKSGPAVVSL